MNFSVKSNCKAVQISQMFFDSNWYLHHSYTVENGTRCWDHHLSHMGFERVTWLNDAIIFFFHSEKSSNLSSVNFKKTEWIQRFTSEWLLKKPVN